MFYRLLTPIFLLFVLSISAFGQGPRVLVNGFGHLEYTLEHKNGKINSFFSLGEHDLFVQAKISDRISFLGELVVKYNDASPTKFLPSLERSLVKFNLNNKHSIIAGKIHTPVNYWNDVYHHGRVFFPVIARPSSFSNFIPIHTLGIQFQGQNLGKLKFGYDVVVGNSLNSTDVFEAEFSPALAFAFHLKPVLGMRIGLSYSYDNMRENGYGAHSGHALGHMGHVMYNGPLTFHTACFSFAYFKEKIEILNEFSNNITTTDSMGTAINFSNFIYLGYNIKEIHTPYFATEILMISNNELHNMPQERLKFIIGYKHSFNYLVNLKAQIEYNSQISSISQPLDNGNTLSFRLQLAYGF